jgi:hypothetical protein
MTDKDLKAVIIWRESYKLTRNRQQPNRKMSNEYK